MSSQRITVRLGRVGIFNFLAYRLKCGTAGYRRLERSELAALSAVATTDLFAVLLMSWLRVEALAMQTHSTGISWILIVWCVNAVALKVFVEVKKAPLIRGQPSKVAVKDRNLRPILGQQWTQVVDR